MKFVRSCVVVLAKFGRSSYEVEAKFVRSCVVVLAKFGRSSYEVGAKFVRSCGVVHTKLGPFRSVNRLAPMLLCSKRVTYVTLEVERELIDHECYGFVQ